MEIYIEDWQLGPMAVSLFLLFFQVMCAVVHLLTYTTQTYAC